MPAGSVTVEFFGIPRQRAGRPELAVSAGTVAEVLAAVARACPGLAGLLLADGDIAALYLVSINGERFVRDGREPVRAGERLLLLSADVGG